jgi:hypothetical protein
VVRQNPYLDFGWRNAQVKISCSWLPILSLAVLCTVSPASGAIIYTTLGPGNAYDSTNGYPIGGSSYGSGVWGAQFTLAAGATVGEAALGVGNSAGDNSPLTVYIESDNAGKPGVILAQLSQVGTIPAWSNGTGGGLVTFSCSGPACTLGAGSYWLVVGESDADTEHVWNFAYQGTTANLAANGFGSFTGPWETFTSTGTAFRIDAASASVPEPRSLIFLGSGLFCLATVLRRRKDLSA